MKWIVLAGVGVIWGAWTLAGVSFASLSVMAFDAPGSTRLWLPWLFAGSAAFWPLWSLGCAVYALVLLLGGSPEAATRALVWSLAGAVPLACVIGAGLLFGKTA